jgi:hypothetical protein
VCGVRVPDGRQFILIQAETSHAEGSIPYVFAFDPSWTSKYLAQGDSAQAGAKVFYGNPDRFLRSVMASAAGGCVNLRADLGLDPNGTDTGVAPPPPPSTPDVPGVPSDAVCAHLPAPASAPPQTQLALDEAAGNQALRDGCKARAAYVALQKRLGKDQAASLRLRDTQQVWVADMMASFPSLGLLRGLGAFDDGATRRARRFGQGSLPVERDAAHAGV